MLFRYVLSSQADDFMYANLAVRGKLIHQVVQDQVPKALEMIRPNTLISFHAGANDVIRPNYDPAIEKPKYRKGVADLTASGGTVVLFTVIEKVDGKSKVAQMWHERFSDFNQQVREVAKEFGAILMEAQDAPFLGDRKIGRAHV